MYFRVGDYDNISNIVIYMIIYLRLGDYAHQLGALPHKRGLRDRDDPRWEFLQISAKKERNPFFVRPSLSRDSSTHKTTGCFYQDPQNVLRNIWTARYWWFGLIKYSFQNNLNFFCKKINAMVQKLEQMYKNVQGWSFVGWKYRPPK